MATSDESEGMLKSALAAISKESILMQKALQLREPRLLLAIKHAASMLAEMRTSALPPKLYYEIYNLCFDSLTGLQVYLHEDHRNHHLADVYEIVEYTGNVLPRLYLMITVGSVFLTTGDAPVTEVLKDMLEMCKGAQNPLRGLFVRYYLCQRTGELNPVTKLETEFYIQFLLANFIEMNKLWVRYQHQGHSKDFSKRFAERKQLETIVGSSILRLSVLDSVDVRMFTDVILPELLSQAVQCRDKLSQEYILDVVVQAFPAEFHMDTLEVFLSCIEKLSPETSLGKILNVSLERLKSYVGIKREEIETRVKTEVKKREIDEINEVEMRGRKTKTEVHNKETKTEGDENDQNVIDEKDKDEKDEKDEKEIDEDDNEKEKDEKDAKEDAIEKEKDEKEKEKEKEDGQNSKEIVDGQEVEVINGEEPEPEVSKLSLSSEPNAAEPETGEVDEAGKPDAKAGNEPELAEVKEEKPLTVEELVDLELRAYFAEAIDLYWSCIVQLEVSSSERAVIIGKFLELVKASNADLDFPTIVETVVNGELPECPEIEQFVLSIFEFSTIGEALNLFKQFPVLVSSQSTDTQLLVATRVVDAILEDANSMKDYNQTAEAFELLAVLIQSSNFGLSRLSNLAKLIAQLKGSTPAETLDLFLMAEKSLREGTKEVIMHIYPVIVYSTLMLLQPREGNPGRDLLNTPESVVKLFQFCFNACQTVNIKGENPALAFRLFITASVTANAVGAEEASYELFSQALVLYEENITENIEQINALAIAVNSIQQFTVFTTENYITLALNLAKYAQHLLKKPDQCQMLISCAHMFWDNQYADGEKVQDILQRAKRSASSVLDTAVKTNLDLELLDGYLYFFQNDVITVNAGDIVKLYTGLKSAELDAGSKGKLDRITKFISEEVDTFPRFQDLELTSHTHT